MDKIAKYWMLCLALTTLCCGPGPQQQAIVDQPEQEDAGNRIERQYERHKAAYDADPSADNLIWLGRFTAYLGRYQEAVDLYSQGIAKYPDDARFLRHRGHRYISMRRFDDAILDLKLASIMTSGEPDQIEPDGMPNAQNIPVSTLQTNIWYHLGLAHYLNHDFSAAEQAYRTCREVGSNDDNWVSASHWLFTIASRMEDDTLAKSYVSSVNSSMRVIENQSYQNLCLFYQGTMEENTLLEHAATAGSASDAILYGLANWHMQIGDPNQGKQLLQRILQGDNKSSFGYIAAEVDLRALNDE